MILSKKLTAGKRVILEQRRYLIDIIITVYVKIFAVDLISLFSQVHASTMKLKPRTFRSAILTPAPYQSQVTSMSPYTWKPLIMLRINSMHFQPHATAFNYVRASWVRRFTKLKICFEVFGANPRNIFPTKISTYMAYDGELC